MVPGNAAQRNGNPFGITERGFKGATTQKGSKPPKAAVPHR